MIENVIFTILSERKLGPKLLGVFAGGRIEEYIPVSNNGASVLEFSYWAYRIFIVILNDIMRSLVIAFYTRNIICIFSNYKLNNLNHKIRVLGINPIVSIFRYDYLLPKIFEKMVQLNGYLSNFVRPFFHFLSGNRLIFVFSIFQSKSLTTSQLRKKAISQALSRKFARIHKLSVPINTDARWLFQTMEK